MTSRAPVARRKPAGKPVGASALRQVRIIGGQWKRTPLAVLDQAGLRPTPDRVRETVFNWLGHLLDGNWASLHCLDLFAGTGAFGFEAASRGAEQVVMVEAHPAAASQLDAVKARLEANQVDVMRGDAMQIAHRLAGQGRHFDLIFLDPPYHQDLLARALPLCAMLLAAGGVVYVESETPLTQAGHDWLAGWAVVRADKAGMVFYHLLQRTDAASSPA